MMETSEQPTYILTSKDCYLCGYESQEGELLIRTDNGKEVCPVCYQNSLIN